MEKDKHVPWWLEASLWAEQFRERALKTVEVNTKNWGIAIELFGAEESALQAEPALEDQLIVIYLFYLILPCICAALIESGKINNILGLDTQ